MQVSVCGNKWCTNAGCVGPLYSLVPLQQIPCTGAVCVAQGMYCKWIQILEQKQTPRIKCAHGSFFPSWWFGQVEFERPGVAASILIYLAYDGEMQTTGDQCKKTVSIQLCDTNNKNHTLGTFHKPFSHMLWVLLIFTSLKIIHMRHISKLSGSYNNVHATMK